MIGFRPPKDLYEDYPVKRDSSPDFTNQEPDPEIYPFAKNPFTKKERFFIVLGALKAALLIGVCFMGALGIIIFILTRIWRV